MAALQSNLERLNLPYPEAVFAINYFAENPLPCEQAVRTLRLNGLTSGPLILIVYTLARELYPGRFRPTLTHTFVKLLADHALLDTCFTQNIDTLERRAGVPAHRIVEAHGSFADQHCIECKRAFDGAQMKAAIERAEIVRCGQCGGLVKPDIVFFGEAVSGRQGSFCEDPGVLTSMNATHTQLPPLFERTVPKLREADLLFVIGTSLTVHPFASLTGLVPAGCPRVLINMERAGDIGGRPDDVVLLGRCDDIVREIAQELGWADELEREWAKTEILVPLEALDREKGAKEKDEGKAGAETAVADDPASQEASAEGAPAVSKAQEEEARVEAEVDVLTEKVAQALALSEDAGVEAARTATITPGSQSTRSGPGSGEASEGAAAHSSESDSRPPVGDTRSPEASIAGKEKEKL